MMPTCCTQKASRHGLQLFHSKSPVPKCYNNVCYPCRIAFNLDQCRHQVNWRLTKIRFYFQCLGVKGDWPWLRSANRLVTGYKSKRLCHRCPSLESSHMDLVKHYILSFTHFIVVIYLFDWYIVQSKCSTLLLRTGTTWAPAGPSGRGRRMASRIAHSKLDQYPPLRNLIPGGDNPFKIKFDIAHTHAICGYGKDDLASCIVFLACRVKLFGGRTIEVQLDHAFQAFKTDCIQHGKTTSITGFDKEELKIKSYLVSQ